MAHTSRCLPLDGVLTTVALPNFGAQKVFAQGKGVTIWQQVRRRTGIIIQCCPGKEPGQLANPYKDQAGIVYFWAADDVILTSYIELRATRFLLPRQCTKITADTTSGGVIWLEEPHTLGPIRND